jgi:hypothetical protein
VPGGGPGHRADQGRTRPGPRLQRGRLADDLAHGAVLDPGAAADGTEHGRAGLHPDPQGPSVDRRYRREGAEGRPGRPLGVVLVRLGAPNMAWSPPPDTDVTVPPSASTSAITAARPRPVTSRSSSGSAGPSAVTSAASTLTVLSSSRAGACVRGGPASKAAVA